MRKRIREKLRMLRRMVMAGFRAPAMVLLGGAITLTADAQSPGRSASKPFYIMAERSAHLWLGSVALDAAYPNAGAQATRGYDLGAVSGGPYDVMRVVKAVDTVSVMSPGANPAAGSVVAGFWDPVNKRLRILVNGAEPADGTNLSSITGVSSLQVRAYGLK